MLSKTRSRSLISKKPPKNPKHLAMLAQLPCVICGSKPVEIHHLRTGVGMGRKSPDETTISLCPAHHRTSNESIHYLGRKAFEKFHGVTELELLAKVRKLLGPL